MIRVTDAAVAAAVAAAHWDWPAVDDDRLPLPTPADVMRPVLEAAAEHLVDDRVAAALKLHRWCHVTDDQAFACERGTYPGGGLVVHSPVCLRDGEAWPCDTARALGFES